jgi:hypothetical protein
MGGIRLGAWPVRARCPGCGELCSHAVLSRDLSTRRLRCKSCGIEWSMPTGMVRTAKTSEAERRAKHERPQREPRTCPVCGNEFVPAHDSQVTCSQGCYNRARYHRGAANLLLLAARARKLDRAMREVT